MVIGDNEQGIKTVAGNPDALGYVSIGTADYDAAHGVPSGSCRWTGCRRHGENVQAGRFPLSRILVLVTKGTPSEPARQLIEFARSAEVRDLVEQQSFVAGPLIASLGACWVASRCCLRWWSAIFGLVAAEAAPCLARVGPLRFFTDCRGSRRQRASTSARCSGARC
ncbi:MAG: hypothetical protein R3F43_01295 [bacterium]